IDGLIRLHILIAFSVCIGVEDKCRPALRLHFIVGFVEHLCIQPTYCSSAATAARPQCIVSILCIHPMMRPKSGVNERDLLRLWIVHSELPATRFERE